MRRRGFSVFVSVAAAVVLVTGCGGGDGEGATAAAPTTGGSSASITISDFKFSPATITVASGARVALTNRGGQAHTVTADDGHSFDSGHVAAGASASIGAPRPGTYPFHCTIHPFMTGKLVAK